MLFQMFDHILLLAPGGRTVFFGETGPHSTNVINYFNSLGASIPPDQNPAESIITAVTANGAEARDWAQTWLDSPEYRRLMDTISSMDQIAASNSDSSRVERVPKGAYALPLHSQVIQLTYRHWIAVWRSGP